MEILNNVKVSLSFNLRQPKKTTSKTVLYAVVKLNDKQMKMPIGVSVYSYQWNRKQQICEVNNKMIEEDRINNMSANKKIFDIKGRYMELINYFCSEEMVTENEIKDTIIKEFEEYKNIGDMANHNAIPKKRTLTATRLVNEGFLLAYGTNESPKVKTSSYRNLEIAKNAFLNYIKDNSNVYDSVKTLSADGLRAYKKHLEEIAKEKGKGNSNSIAQRCNLIVRCVNALVEDGRYQKIGLVKLDNFKQKNIVSNDESKRRALTDEEVNAIMSVEGLTEKEKVYKEVFEMQLETGVRFSDLYKLFVGEYDVKMEDGVKTETVMTQKEGITAYIIVNDKIDNLQKKYADGLPFKLTESSYNKALKDICKKANLTEKYTYYADFIGTKKEVTESLCDVITNHFARHTFITNKAREGWKYDTLCYCTGHADDAMIRKVYAHITADDKVKKVVKEFKRVHNISDDSVTLSNVELIEKGKKEKENDIINECKNVLVYLGADYEDIADVNNIDDLNVKIYVDYHRAFENIGISTKELKDIYNTKNTSLKEKKSILKKLIEETKKRIKE